MEGGLPHPAALPAAMYRPKPRGGQEQEQQPSEGGGGQGKVALQERPHIATSDPPVQGSISPILLRQQEARAANHRAAQREEGGCKAPAIFPRKGVLEYNRGPREGGREGEAGRGRLRSQAGVFVFCSFSRSIAVHRGCSRLAGWLAAHPCCGPTAGPMADGNVPVLLAPSRVQSALRRGPLPRKHRCLR